MNKRRVVEVIIGIVLLVIGWIIGNKWQITECKLDLSFNIVDVITLIVTIVMGIYIAWIIEKEVQDKRNEKDMYLSEIGTVEDYLGELENMFQSNNSQSIDYKHVVNLEQRTRSRKNRILKYIIDNSHGKIKSELQEHDEQLKTLFKNLKGLLTQTNASDSEPKDINVVNNIACYSAERTNLILTSLSNIYNKLLDIMVLVNKM